MSLVASNSSKMTGIDDDFRDWRIPASVEDPCKYIWPPESAERRRDDALHDSRLAGPGAAGPASGQVSAVQPVAGIGQAALQGGGQLQFVEAEHGQRQQHEYHGEATERPRRLQCVGQQRAGQSGGHPHCGVSDCHAHEASDRMKPCAWVILWPRLMMMPDRIGTIGNMHGVKASSRPAPKKNETISQKLPSLNSLATCEFSLAADGGDAESGGAALISCCAAGRGATEVARVGVACAAVIAWQGDVDGLGDRRVAQTFLACVSPYVASSAIFRGCVIAAVKGDFRLKGSMEHFHVAGVGIMLHLSSGHGYLGDLDAQSEASTCSVREQIIFGRNSEAGEQRVRILDRNIQAECLVRLQECGLF